MASSESMFRDLIDKLRDMSLDELSEVVDFAELLRAKRLASATQTDESARRTRLQRYTTWTDDDLREFQAVLGTHRVIESKLWA